MTAHIIYYNYLTPDGSCMSLGGIQTYITNLIPVFKAKGYDVCIYQRSIVSFKAKANGADVIGIPFNCKHRKMLRGFRDIVLANADKDKDIIVFACDTTIQDCAGYHTIAIQHGISWDKPCPNTGSSIRYYYDYIHMRYNAWRQIKRIEKVDQVVCVDYNFTNWYRAEVPFVKIKTNVVPNFCDIPCEIPQKPQNKINIIFARRLFEYRGTRIFANAIIRILKEYSIVNVLVAGEGPDGPYLQEKLGNFKSVTFTRFESFESLKIHSDKHIAVIPTIGSEGTSLSLLEAMASGCAVIATNVGGMTNIVLDGYNGLLINPDEEDLCKAMKRLIDSEALRKQLAENAYDTAASSFSLRIWRERWSMIISNIAMKNEKVP